jgi:hypothetical protein
MANGTGTAMAIETDIGNQYTAGTGLHEMLEAVTYKKELIYSCIEDPRGLHVLQVIAITHILAGVCACRHN